MKIKSWEDLSFWAKDDYVFQPPLNGWNGAGYLPNA
jgi:hypothetical protein